MRGLKTWVQSQSDENQNLLFGLTMTASWFIPGLLLLFIPFEKGGC